MNTQVSPRYSATQLAELLDMPAPTEEQARVIEAPLEPLLVVAGAGSGKTATMSQKVVYLVANGLAKPEEILGLTFTRKATGELAARVRSRLEQLSEAGVEMGPSMPDDAASRAEAEMGELPGDNEEPTIATYDSFAGSLVRDYGLHAGIDPDYLLLTDARATMLVTEMVQEWDGDLPFDSRDSLVTRILELDQHLASNLLSLTEAELLIGDMAHEFAAVPPPPRGRKPLMADAASLMDQRLVLLEMVRRFRETKKRLRLLTFADQTAIACDLVLRESMAPVIMSLRQRYKAVLLDEFQDTSPAQTRLLSAIFVGSGVVAVGDPNQAIYGWRGASASALAGFHEEFGCWPGDEEQRRKAALDHVLPLSIAWRNDPVILDVANKISAPLRHPVPQPGDPEVEPVPVAKLQPRPGIAPTAGKVYGAYVQDPIAQAQEIADYLEERLSPETSLAVLVRSNAEGAMIARALEERGLPIDYSQPGGLLGIPEVRDVRALLSIVADPERGEAVLRLLSARGIAAAELRALYGETKRLSQRNQEHAHAQVTQEAEEGATATLADVLEELLRRNERVAQTARREETGTDAQLSSGQASAAGSRPLGVEVHIEVPGLSEATLRHCVYLAAQIRQVSESRHLPLPDLVMAAERALGLDVTVAARLQQGLGRRALDEFASLASKVWTEMEQPSLDNFLLWLDAIDAKERGSEAPIVEPQPGAIQIMTMHASKGLEWDHVVVAGLSEGSFPGYRGKAKEDGSLELKGWLSSLKEFPAPLRQDADTLPVYPFAQFDLTTTPPEEVRDLLTDYYLAQGRHYVSQERCLAYVAVTRARHSVLMAGSHFTKTGSDLHPMSRFLRDVANMVEPFGAGLQTQDELEAQAERDGTPFENRAASVESRAMWPRQPRDYPEGDPLRQEWEAMRRGAALVQERRAAGAEEKPGSTRAQRWAEDVELLLAERRRQRDSEPAVHIPAHVAATGLGALAHDPQAYALGLRRPIPPEPNTKARLGTLFHELISEQLSEHASLMSFAEVGEGDRIPESAREDFDAWMTTALGQEFLAEGYVLHEAEAARELPLGGTTVRCRMDAIFRRPDLAPDAPGAWLIVDWKTNARRRELPQQLSIYVHVWAQSLGIPLSAVRAAYVYVAQPERSFEEISDAELVPLEAIESLLQAQA